MTEYSRVTQQQIDAGNYLPLTFHLTDTEKMFPDWECPNCYDRKVVMTFKLTNGMNFLKSVPYAKAKYFDRGEKKGWLLGETQLEDCPVCSQGRMQEWLTRKSRLSGKELEVRLDGFFTHGVYAGKKQAKQAAVDMLARNREAVGMLTFWGDYGTGKTHLQKALINGFRMIGMLSVYTTAADMLDDIRSRFSDDHGVVSVTAAIEEYSKIRVLAIDELDKINLTGWVKETISRIFEARGKAEVLTIVGTNMNPDTMPAEFGYLASRMRGGVVANVPAPDMRPVMVEG
jgi:DNA replication protein DnaC